jgi:hypothetical protein
MTCDISWWANLATIATAIIALAALVGAFVQIKSAQQSQREATASGLYGNYLALAVEHPMMAGGYIAIPAKGSEPDPAFERYEWFVSVMLHAFEQILELTDGDEIWRKALEDQIGYHEGYLRSPRFVSEHYSDSLRELFPTKLA